jgi:beta-aspartyl-peptidase (threonine type)
VPRIEWAVALHGGSLGSSEEEDPGSARFRSLAAVLERSADLLADGAAAIEVAESAIRSLEDDPLFNAGRGSVFTRRGTHELDATIMDGRSHAIGSVVGTRNVRNPITLARRAMESGRAGTLVEGAADSAANELGVAKVPQDFFTTNSRLAHWQDARRSSGSKTAEPELGGVGVVVLDRYGNLAAATSTGGQVHREAPSTWSDASRVGAAIFADNQSAAVVAVAPEGVLERHVLAHEVATRFQFSDMDLQEVAQQVVESLAEPSGIVALAADGRVTFSVQGTHLLGGFADATGRREVGSGLRLHELTDP